MIPRIAASILLFALAALAQQARGVYIYAPNVRLMVGEQVQLEATARSLDGSPLGGGLLVWAAVNPAIATIDSTGLVSTAGVGIATFNCRFGNVTGSIQIQVLPASIEISPKNVTAKVGDRIPFTAVALDINGQPIPNAESQIRWQVLGAQAGGTQNARIDAASGVMVASGEGVIILRALINYSAAQSRFLTQFISSTQVTIERPADYRITRLLSSADTRPSFALRLPAAGTRISVNERGQMAFTASLDGLTSAVLVHDGGRLETKITTGTPTSISGGVTALVFPPVINNRGQILTEIQAMGGGAGLILISPDGVDPVIYQGANTSGYENVSGFQPFALNDEGDAVFRASFRYAGTTASYSGIFLRRGSALEKLWANDTPLAGLTGSANPIELGVDNNGVVWFVAEVAGRRGLYRVAPGRDPEKMIASGDVIDGATVRPQSPVSNLSVAPDGSVAARVSFAGTNDHIVRFLGAERTMLRLGTFRGILHAANGGSILFFGAPQGSPVGLYRWSGDKAEQKMVLNQPSPEGSMIRNFLSAAHNSQGQIWAAITTDKADPQFLRIPDAAPFLVQADSRIDIPANLTIFRLLAGSRTGPPSLLMGSNPGSLYHLTGAGLEKRLMFGDKLTGGQSFNGTYTPIEGRSGDLLFADRYGFAYRLKDGKLDRLPKELNDGVTVSAGRAVAVNESGAVLFEGSTNRAHNRLSLVEGDRVRVLATTADAAPYATALPGGATISIFNSTFTAIDDRGRVLTSLTVRNGPSGLYLWENGSWKSALIPNQTQVAGIMVTGLAFYVKTDGDKFYTLLNLLGGGNMLAAYDGSEWTPAVNRDELAPTGSTINSVSAFDVRTGGIAFIANFNGGATRALLFRSGGSTRLVHSFSDPVEPGNYLMTNSEVTLRDDRRIYFSGVDIYDRFQVYSAEPLF